MRPKLQIILPPRDEDTLSDLLRQLNEKISEVRPELDFNYGLGGSFGYSVDFENDVFVTRSFDENYNCDCGGDDREQKWMDAHHHALDCYQTELRQRKLDSGVWHSVKKYGIEHLESEAPYARRDVLEGQFIDELCTKHGLDRTRGAWAHCTCGRDSAWDAFLESAEGSHKPSCATVLPNFRHKASGFEVRWHKWIGRSMELTNEPPDVAAVIEDCLRSLATKA